jgi:arylsulfatase A-like enzyme/tetratricopeptide (TPR) repeat protein
VRAAGVAVAAWLAFGCAPEVERVLLVSIDTLRADHVGAYGASDARTPTLDAIAAAGARFEAAVSPAPLTLPSHASLLTGLDPPEHGVRHNSIFRLAPDVPTLAERLREAGYATGAVVGAFVLARQFGLARGFDHYDDAVGESSGSGSMGVAERPAAAVVDAALAWLESAPERWFLWTHFYDPHAEYRPPAGFAVSFGMRPYAGEIAYADAQLGRLLGAVDERWPDGRTLVVVTSDHGESLGQHGERTHSHLVYEATQHVPLLLRGPGIAAGLVIPDVVATKDVAPTLLALAGAPALPGATGRDLRPLLRGGRLPDRPAYVETLAPQLDWDWSPLIGLRAGSFKYIRAPRPELYDLARDPGELRNLAPLEPGRASELDAALGERLRGARGAGPTHSPDARERERLESLGYVVPDAAPSRALGEVGGPDPKDEIRSVEAVQRADQLLAVGEPTRALEQLEGARGGFVVHGLRATAALAAGDPERAEVEARAAVAASPASPVGWARLAAALAAQDRLAEARGAWEASLERSPGSGPSWTALGLLAEEERDLEAAERCYRAALEAAQADPQARWRLAALRIERGEVEPAEELLAGVEPSVLSSPEAVLRLARAERLAGRPEAAARRLADALERQPTLLPIRLEAALAAEAAGDGEAARREHEAGLSVAERALADSPAGADRPSVLFYRGRFLFGLGREAEARRSLGEALEAGLALPREQREIARRLASAPDGSPQPAP